MMLRSPATPSEQSFKTDVVCTHVSVLFDCANGVYVDVQSYPSSSGFGSVSISEPTTGGNFVDNTKYSPGGPGDIVVVRLFYQWPVFRHGTWLQYREPKRQ